MEKDAQCHSQRLLCVTDKCDLRQSHQVRSRDCERRSERGLERARMQKGCASHRCEDRYERCPFSCAAIWKRSRQFDAGEEDQMNMRTCDLSSMCAVVSYWLLMSRCDVSRDMHDAALCTYTLAGRSRYTKTVGSSNAGIW